MASLVNAAYPGIEYPYFKIVGPAADGTFMKMVANDEVTLVDACSGVDGTWGMQACFHAQSLAVAAPMAQRIREAEPDHIATDCPLSALRIQETLGRDAVHPVVLLRYAYGLSAE